VSWPVSISALLLLVRFPRPSLTRLSAPLPEMTVISVLSGSPSGHGSGEPPDLVIGVRQEAGEGLQHPAGQAACRLTSLNASSV